MAYIRNNTNVSPMASGPMTAPGGRGGGGRGGRGRGGEGLIPMAVAGRGRGGRGSGRDYHDDGNGHMAADGGRDYHDDGNGHMAAGSGDGSRHMATADRSSTLLNCWSKNPRVCRDDNSCNRQDCYYHHTTTMDGRSPAVPDCRYKVCKNPECKFRHSTPDGRSPAAARTQEIEDAISTASDVSEAFTAVSAPASASASALASATAPAPVAPAPTASTADHTTTMDGRSPALPDCRYKVCKNPECKFRHSTPDGRSPAAARTQGIEDATATASDVSEAFTAVSAPAAAAADTEFRKIVVRGLIEDPNSTGELFDLFKLIAKEAIQRSEEEVTSIIMNLISEREMQGLTEDDYQKMAELDAMIDNKADEDDKEEDDEDDEEM